MTFTRLRVLAVVVLAAAGCALLAWRLGLWPGRQASGAVPAPRATSAAGGSPAPAGDRAAAASGLGLEPEEERAAEPAGLLRLEGQVIDDEERPIAGATVSVSTIPRRQVLTEADGSFALDGLLPRVYTVGALKEDGLAGPLAVHLTARTEPVILRLSRGGALEVTVVVAATGRPVAGASVGLRDEAVAGASTGADGKALLRPLGRGRHVVDARAAGYVPAVLVVSAGGPPGAVRRLLVELGQGGAVSGIVKDEADKPVAGALVRALPGRGRAAGGTPRGRGQGAGPRGRPFAGKGPPGDGEPPDAGPRAERDGETTHSDPDGRWAFTALPAGSFRFSASDETHGPGTTAPLVLDGRSATSGVVITLEAGARVAGMVVRRDRTPVASALVRAAEAGRGGGTAPSQTYTDGGGRFKLTGLPRRAVELVASGESAASQVVPVDLAARPDQDGLTLVLDVEGRIAGTVLDGRGLPVSGAHIIATPAATGWRPRAGGAVLRGLQAEVSDSAGHFVLGGLAEGAYRLRATREADAPLARGGAPGGAPGTVLAQVGATDVKLLLEDQGGVRGKVLFADGTAPRRFRVAAGGPAVAFGGEDGAFEVDAPAGEVSVTVSGPQFLKVTVPAAQVVAGAVTDVGTITVEHGRTISGLVLGPGGAPVGGATVVAGTQLVTSGAELASGPGVYTTTSADDGHYLVAGVPAGMLLVAAGEPTAGRSAIVRVPASEGSAELDLQLEQPGSLSGRVSSAGKPLGGSVVSATPQSTGQGVFATRAGADGAYRFDPLAADTYTVSAKTGKANRGTTQDRPVTITAGHAAHLDIDVPPGAVTVAIGIAPPPGVIVQAAQVVLVSGAVQAATAAQLRDAIAARGDGASHEGFVFLGLPVPLKNVVPGAYTGCAVALPASVLVAHDFGALSGKLDRLACLCGPVTIADAPEAQAVTLPVPPAPAL